MLVTLTILAIVTVAALPGMARFVARHRLAAVGNELLGLVMLARNESLMRNARITLCRSRDANAPVPVCAPAGSSWADGVLVFADPTGNLPAQPASTTDLIRVRGAIPPGYTIERLGQTSSSVTFIAGRLKTGTLGVSFEIRAPNGDKRCLIIATTGRARIVGETCAE